MMDSNGPAVIGFRRPLAGLARHIRAIWNSSYGSCMCERGIPPDIGHSPWPKPRPVMSLGACHPMLERNAHNQSSRRGAAIVATMAVAMMGPMPGIVAKRWLIGLFLCHAMIWASAVAIRLLSG